MARTPKLDVRLTCPRCGKEPVPDPEKSNHNWQVFDMDCKHCGTRLKLKAVE